MDNTPKRKIISPGLIKKCSFSEARFYVDCMASKPRSEYEKLIDGLATLCQSFFGNLDQVQQSGIWMLYQEFAKNSISNGPEIGERIAKIGQIENLLLFGFGDNGEYYRREEIKKLWEGGQNIPSTKGRFINMGGGLQDALGFFPYIFIDTSTAIFYAGKESDKS